MQNEIKMFNNKKGFQGASIVLIILFIFVGVGIILPYVNEEFDISGSDIDVENVGEELVEGSIEDVSSIGIGDVLKSVGKMFFWTFGDLPFWLDAIFIVLRIILVLILIKTFTPFL